MGLKDKFLELLSLKTKRARLNNLPLSPPEAETVSAGQEKFHDKYDREMTHSARLGLIREKTKVVHGREKEEKSLNLEYSAPRRYRWLNGEWKQIWNPRDGRRHRFSRFGRYAENGEEKEEKGVRVMAETGKGELTGAGRSKKLTGVISAVKTPKSGVVHLKKPDINLDQ